MENAREFISNFIEIFNIRTFLLSAGACFSTWLSIQMGWHADYPMALIGTAVIFPIVFSLNGAYARREDALKNYAEIKAGMRSIFHALTQWSGGCHPVDRAHYATLCAQPIYSLRKLLTGEREDLDENERCIYRDFSEVSQAIETRCNANRWAGGKSGACYGYLNEVMSEFEKLKHIYQYRTPRSLQAFSDVFITVLPLLYGPVFANMAGSVTSTPLLYLVPMLFAFILSSLDNIQAHLEDPFDGVGVDDLVFRAEKFERSLMDERSSAHPQTEQLDAQAQQAHLAQAWGQVG